MIGKGLMQVQMVGQTQGAVAALYNQSVALPEGMQNRLPRWTGPLGVMLCDHVLPALRLRWVDSSSFEQDGRKFHTFRMSVWFRTTTITLSTAAAYYLFMLLLNICQSGTHEDAVVEAPGLGQMYLPKWAHHPLMHELRARVMENEGEMKLVVNELARLSQEDAVPRNDEPELLPPPAEGSETPTKPTLH